MALRVNAIEQFRVENAIERDRSDDARLSRPAFAYEDNELIADMTSDGVATAVGAAIGHAIVVEEEARRGR